MPSFAMLAADKELDMHQRCLFALALALSGVMVYGQAVRNPKTEKVICDELAAEAPGAVETFQRATMAMDRGAYQQAADLRRSHRLRGASEVPWQHWGGSMKVSCWSRML